MYVTLDVHFQGTSLILCTWIMHAVSKIQITADVEKALGEVELFVCIGARAWVALDAHDALGRHKGAPY